eukprot:COSAG01_NODE_8625_length_2716_cov_2.053878_4_plen_279_part_00
MPECVVHICSRRLAAAGSSQSSHAPSHHYSYRTARTKNLILPLLLQVNFFDTAQAYQVDGDRCSERMLGVALGERRREVVIASKFGLHVGEEQTVFDGAAVTRAIDETLEALGTDYLDLMQIHWPGNIGYIDQDRACWSDAAEVAAALEGAVSAGKLRYYGCCNFGTDDLVAFEQGPCTSHHKLHGKYCVVTFVEGALTRVRTPCTSAGGKPVSNQLPYNLLFRTIESGILPACIAKNMGVLTYSSLQQVRACVLGAITVSHVHPVCRSFTYDDVRRS